MKNKVTELLDEISKKPGITEVIINKLDNVYVEMDGEFIRLDVKFTDEEIDEYCQFVARQNRKTFDGQHPLLDGNLSDGSRINLVHRDYTNSCHVVTIRRFTKSIKNFDSTPGIFGLSAEMIQFLKILVRARVNILVAGGTGVGKTTCLNLLLQEIPSKERLITIEDTRELMFNLPNVVRLEARVGQAQDPGLTTRDLIKNTLRMRPDRIIVGECRGGEAFDLLQAMNTGHEGSMTSIHANSPGEALIRLENLFMLSGHEIPLRALRYQIASALDFVIQLRRDRNGNREVFQISEVTNMEGDRILMQDIVLHKNGELKFTGLVPACFERLQKAGLAKDFFSSL